MRVLLALVFGGWAWATPISYVLDLTVVPDGALQGTAQITFPCPGGVDFVLRLYPNHFGPFLLPTGVWVDGADALWEALDPTVLVVGAPSPCGPTTAVRVAFQGRVPRDPHGYGIFFHGGRTMTLAQFYPILAPWAEGWRVHPTFDFGDNLVADAADYVLTVRVPPGWVPVGSGEEEEVEPGLWRLTGQGLREMGLVLVQGFAERRARHASGVVLRAVFPKELGPAAERALEIAAQALSVFSEHLGPYPFPDLDMVFVPLWSAGGVEYPRLILIAESYAHDPGHPFFAEIVAHELAHQWWYGEVGTDQVAEPWLDEGLATYTAGLYFAARGELEAKLGEWEVLWAWAQRLYPQGRVDSPLWEFAVSAGARRSYGGYAYAGAALLLHEIRSLLGDAAFFAALRRFREEQRGRIAPASALLALFREAGGPAVEGLLARYLRRPVLQGSGAAGAP